MEVNHNQGLITLENVSKRYGNVLALDRACFEVREGEVFGYIGPNGAGKTTTIKIMVGLLSDFQGKLRIAGHAMPAGRQQVHQILGYLPQKVGFQEWRTVDHALRTLGQLSGLPKPRLEQRIWEVLNLLGLTPVRFRSIGQLSGGMVQKLGLAQALLHKPKLLILDEPLAGLDPASRYQVKALLQGLSEEGTTIFFSSHILSDVQDIATRIAILDHGRIKQVGTLEELKSHFDVPHALEIVLSRDSGRWKELLPWQDVLSIEQPTTHRLIIHLDDQADRDELTQRVIHHLIQVGCFIRSLNPVTPSLDEVYLRYVGGGENA